MNATRKGVKPLAIFLGLAGSLLAANPELDRARKLYNLTDFDQSLKVLRAMPEKDAAVYELMGLNFFMQADFKKATDALEKAVAAEPQNSDYALWLARAYGRRAETSNPISAPMQASKARQYFEKSVQLNPANLEAWNDLFEYYLEAPGFLGGGVDKAQAAAKRIAALNAAEGYWAEAKLAEKHKEYGSAEEHLRRAVDAAPGQIGKIIELARFLAKQGRYQEADQSIARAEKIAPDSPRVIFARAELYVKSGQNLEAARALLKRYISSSLTPDDPPRSDAEKLLQKARGS
jgi:tetratricopeptide (TPR) repeat protein